MALDPRFDIAWVGCRIVNRHADQPRAQAGYNPNPVSGYLRELAINAVMLAGALWLFVRPTTRFALDSVLRLTRPSPTSPDEPDQSVTVERA